MIFLSNEVIKPLQLFGLNITQLMSEKTSEIYTDIRFWLVIVSLCVLIGMTIQTYPG